MDCSEANIQFLKIGTKEFPKDPRWKDLKMTLANKIETFILDWRDTETWKIFGFIYGFEIVDPVLLPHDIKEFLMKDLPAIAQKLGCYKENINFLKKEHELMPSATTVRTHLKKKIDFMISNWRNDMPKLLTLNLLQLDDSLLKEAQNLENDTSKDLRKLWTKVARQLNLTQSEFCKQTGIPLSTFNDWYNGKTKRSNYCESVVAKFIVLHSKLS